MTLISILLKASILLFVAALPTVLFRQRMSAATRHLVWMLVVIGLLLLPVFSIVLPPWTAFTTPARDTLTPARLGQDLISSFQRTEEIRVPLSAPMEQAKAIAMPVSIPWSGVLATVFVMGVFLLLARLVIEQVSIQRLLRGSVEVTDPQWKHLLHECAEIMGVQRAVRLLRSSEENMPIALGIRHETIVIPAVADTWSEDRRRAVVLHEMSHLIRHDCLSQMLAAVACALYWVHPGAWWIARRLRIERELACDDQVLSLGANAREYADHLLELAYALRSGRTVAVTASMAGSEQLEGRLLAALDAARNRAVPALRSHLAGLTILIVLLVPLAAATVSRGQVSDSAQPESREFTGGIVPAAAPVASVPREQPQPVTLSVMITKPPKTQSAAPSISGRLAFDVAAIKPTNADPANGYCHGIDTNVDSAPKSAPPTPLGRCVFRSITLDHLIWLAYVRGNGFSLDPDLMVLGGPTWTRSDTFDIEGEASDGTLVKERDLWVMLQSLLADRFKLQFHRDTKEVSGFALIIAKNGPKLTPAADPEGGQRVFLTRSVRPSETATPLRGQQVLHGQNLSMSMFAGSIAQFGGPLVTDETKLAGTYDLQLTWQPEDGATMKGRPVLPTTDGTAALSLDSALQEQLGLRLVSKKVPVEILVVDRAEKPNLN